MLLGSAGVEAVWSGAPTAEEIRAQDEQRLLAAPVFAEEGADEDAGLIATLVKERTPDDLARALLVLLRKDLPAPEDLTDPGEGPQRRQRKDRDAAGGDDYAPAPWPGDRLQPDEVTWFRLDIGRNRNADPKWLIPLICRIGGITKQQIGSIRTFPEETRFEVALTHADAFRAAAAQSKEEARITPSEAPTPGSMKGARNRKFEKDGEARPYAKKPFRRDEDGQARPPFKKKPWSPEGDAGRSADGEHPFKKKPYAPRTDAALGEGGFNKKPGFKDKGDKKPFTPKAGFKGKPDFKAGGKPFAKGPKGKRA
jgi:ATP-dependent RNA helicase DeaD